MTEVRAERVSAGIALYSRLFLSVYDWLALGLNCRFLWRCPSHHLLELYNQHASANHLDIGVGTGYFMDRCSFPSSSPRLALMDLSPNSLRAAGKRLARYSPRTYLRNALEPFNLEPPGFDSVGLMNLLHCLPGDMKTKAVVFEHAREVMNPGAALFGSSILYRGVTRSFYTTLVLRANNRAGTMTNLEDDVDDLRESLHRHFSESSVHVIGCEALFWARK